MDTNRPELLVEVVSTVHTEFLGHTYDLADPADFRALFSLLITRRLDGQCIFPSTVAIENVGMVFCYWELVPLLKATMKAIICEWLSDKKGINNGELVKTAMKLCEEFPAMATTAKLKGEV